MAEIVYPGSLDKEESKISRRSFVAGVTGVALTAAGGFGATKFIAGKKESAPAEEYVPVDYSISSAQAEANIEALALPNLYEGRPWADPEQLFGLTSEELKDIAAVPITPETYTNEGFTEAVRQKMELLANSGRTKRDVNRARELGYPVGERDEYNTELGNYDEYVKEYYLDSMVDGFLSGARTENVNDAMKIYFADYAKDYETAINDPLWHDHATLLIDAEYLGQQPEYGESKVIGLTIGRPVKEGDWKDARNVHVGKIVLDVQEGLDDKYILRPRRFIAHERE